MLRRPSRNEPSAPPLPPDIEVVDVTRLDIVMDTGLGLTYDLESGTGYSYGETDTHLELRFPAEGGERVVKIALARILYTEKRPHKLNKVKPSGSI